MIAWKILFGGPDCDLAWASVTTEYDDDDVEGEGDGVLKDGDRSPKSDSVLLGELTARILLSTTMA
jgi:hypothetical protein